MTTTATIGPEIRPPIGWMEGAVQSWRRSTFRIEPGLHSRDGWEGLDRAGNAFCFIPDGTRMTAEVEQECGELRDEFLQHMEEAKKEVLGDESDFPESDPDDLPDPPIEVTGIRSRMKWLWHLTVTAFYVEAGLDLGEADSYFFNGEPVGYRRTERRFKRWEKRYARLGYEPVPRSVWTGAGGYGKPFAHHLYRKPE